MAPSYPRDICRERESIMYLLLECGFLVRDLNSRTRSLFADGRTELLQSLQCPFLSSLPRGTYIKYYNLRLFMACFPVCEPGASNDSGRKEEYVSLYFF